MVHVRPLHEGIEEIERLALTGDKLITVTNPDVGFAIVGLFVLTWIVAALVWRFGRVEEKWGLPAG